jgi:AAA domain
VRLIFIYEMPATGKLTVARALAAKTGYKLFHNHLVVDLLLSVFEFGTPEFVRLREEIWLAVMKEACNAGIAGLIFTFAPEKTVRPTFVNEVGKIVSEAGGRLEFVELECPLEELKRRMGDESRSEFGKLTSVELFEQLLAEGVFGTPEMPEAAVRIDTSACTPEEAADEIVRALGLVA